MIQKLKYLSVSILLYCIITYPAYAQTQAFDSLANKLNRISNSKKTESLELLDNLYQIAFSNPDNSLFLARCLYEESILNIYPHFFKKLKRLCNDLTEENLRMSAYIKMGMSTKQIAQLLNIADNSVFISRHRIKKKLKLPEKESLGRFINSL